LDRLKIGGPRSKQWEDSILATFAGREGWVISNEAVLGLKPVNRLRAAGSTCFLDLRDNSSRSNNPLEIQQIREILGPVVLLPRRQRWTLVIAQGHHSHRREAEHWEVRQDAHTQIQDKRDYKLSKVDLGQQAATIKSRLTQYRALDLL
jgi:hypothetical protein